MTSDNRKRVVLVILVGILAFTLAQAWRSTRTVPVAADVAEPSSSDIPAAIEGRIRLDLIRKDHVENVGENNLFEYRRDRSPIVAAPVAPRPVIQPPPVSQAPVMRPASPPPPPSIPLRYQGYAVVANGNLTAFLSDDTQTYSVNAGEIVLGRFRITRITTNSIEIEDLQFRRRQTLPLQR
jgi:hypothetical protein